MNVYPCLNSVIAGDIKITEAISREKAENRWLQVCIHNPGLSNPIFLRKNHANEPHVREIGVYWAINLRQVRNLDFLQVFIHYCPSLNHIANHQIANHTWRMLLLLI